jgi:predicted nucleic acid-binding protein
MNGNELLLDTNIVLYLLAGDKTVASILDQKKIYLSVISEIELYGFGHLTITEEKKIDRFINDCVLIDINEQIKTTAIRLRKRYRIKVPDSIIAATSIYLNVPLISADNDLKKIEEITFILYAL